MDFKTYTKYLRFAWDEELARVEEWLVARLNDEDWGPDGDKPWVGGEVEEIGLPDRWELEKALANRNIAADFAIIDSEDDFSKENLYLILRDLL